MRGLGEHSGSDLIETRKRMLHPIAIAIPRQWPFNGFHRFARGRCSNTYADNKMD
jgi:hypothetical protein